MQQWLLFGGQIFILSIIIILSFYIILAVIIKASSLFIKRIEDRRQFSKIFLARKEEVIMGITSILATHLGTFRKLENHKQISYKPKLVSRWKMAGKLEQVAGKSKIGGSK